MNGFKVHVLASLLLHQPLVANALGVEGVVAVQLAGTEIEHEHLVVIQRPHAVRPRRLQPVRALQVAADGQVGGKHLQNDGLQIAVLEEAHFVQTVYEGLVIVSPYRGK